MSSAVTAGGFGSRLRGLVALAALLAVLGGCSATSTNAEPIAEAETWMQAFWDAQTARTQSQDAFLSEDAFFRLAPYLHVSATRGEMVGFLRYFFGESMEEFSNGRLYLDADAVAYPNTVDLTSTPVSEPEFAEVDSLEFAELNSLRVGPDGIESLEILGAATQAPEFGPHYPDFAVTSRELAVDYERAWANGDVEALTSLYAPQATVTDHLAGTDVSGIDAILETAQVTDETIVLDRAADHHPTLADRLGESDAVYGYTGVVDGGLSIEMWMLAHSIDTCPGDVAIVLALDHDHRIVAERWLHSPDSIRDCIDPNDIPQGWWTGRDLPTPLAQRLTSTIDTGSQTIEIYNGTPKLEAMLQDALASFDRAGLPEPIITSITFDSQDSRCESKRGNAQWSEDRTDILICTDADADWTRIEEYAGCGGADCPAPQRIATLLLHEIGHAWTAAHLTPARQQAFIDHVELTTWNGKSVAWEQRGVEWAAETLAWGLSEATTRELMLNAPDCATLAEGFHILTRTSALNTCD